MILLKSLKDRWPGDCITHIRKDLEVDSRNIYLTFDDGPDAKNTEMILKVLDKYGAKVSFFVITEKAKKNSTLTKEIKSASHSIGDHSLDHIWSFSRMDCF